MVAFSDNPKTEWLNEPPSDRQMKLLADFWFDDRAGRRWLAKSGYVVDGASIPRALWSLVGSPFTGSYRRASIVHDVACDASLSREQRRAADRMFYEACVAGGCTPEEATILYTGVRIGSGWSQKFDSLLFDRSRPSITRQPSEKRIEADFQLTTNRVLSEPIVDDAREVEARVDKALAQVNDLTLGLPPVL